MAGISPGEIMGNQAGQAVTRLVLYRLWRFVVTLAIGMMLCAALMGYGRLIYWAIFKLWGPG